MKRVYLSEICVIPKSIILTLLLGSVVLQMEGQCPDEIIFHEGPSLIRITEDSATVTWESLIDTFLYYELELVDKTAGGVVTGTLTDTTSTYPRQFTFTGLQADHVYEIYLRGRCDGTTTTEWSDRIDLVAEDCPGSWTFFYTDEIEYFFQTRYPVCTEMKQVIVRDFVTDLSDFTPAVSIDVLNIRRLRDGFEINNLRGLENVKSIGRLLILNSPGPGFVASLDGLQNLETANSISINGADGLVDISAIKDVDVENLFITGCHGLSSLPMFTSIDSINALRVEGNSALTSLSGLSGVKHVSNLLSIVQNESLENLNGLQNIVSVGELEDFGFVGMTLSITNNDILDDISALESMVIDSAKSEISYLEIKDNDSLSLCSVDPICATLDRLFSFEVDIENNRDGCLTADQVQLGCNICEQNFYFTRQEQVDSIALLVTDSNTINCDLVITGPFISNVENLDIIEKIYGNIIIQDCSRLQSIGSFNELVHCNSIVIADNDSLNSITGFGKLPQIKGDLIVSNDSSLIELSGFDSLAHVEGSLVIQSNPIFQTWDGFEKFKSINGNITVVGNDSLKQIDMLDSLFDIGGSIILFENDALIGVNFNSADTIGGDVFVNGNDKLVDLEHFIRLKRLKGSFIFQNNLSLKEIKGLDSLSVIEGSLIVQENDSLHSLPAFNMLTKIKGGLQFTSNDQLVALPMFSTLKRISLDITIDSNAIIKSINFSGLDSLGGDLIVNHNDKATTIESLGEINMIGGSVRIYSNRELRSLVGFAAVDSIKGDLFLTDMDSLKNLSGLDMVTYLGGDLFVKINGINDCTGICALLDSTGVVEGNIELDTLINGFNCSKVERIQQHCEISAIPIGDVNPDFIGGFLTCTDIDSVEMLSSISAIECIKVIRQGIVCDGASRGLVVLPVGVSGRVEWELDTLLGRFDPVWGDSTIMYFDQPHAMAVYHAPKLFPKDTIERHRFEGVEADYAQFSLQLTASNGDIQNANYRLRLVRPPVVLMHGTFDTPQNCWQTPMSVDEISLQDKLTDAGFATFAVDYSATNGKGLGPEYSCNGSFLFNKGSCFESNKQVIHKNNGGIEDAIFHFRNNMNIIATRADVVGHSMGGVLPRVYASFLYQFDIDSKANLEYEYNRLNNFNKGDIRRLLTISSTHHGSDMSYYLSFMNRVAYGDDSPFMNSIFDQGITQATLAKIQLTFIWFFQGMTPNRGAVMDQLPKSRALRRIGATSIPAHAIVTTVNNMSDIKINSADPGQSYYKRLELIAYYLYYNRPVLKELVRQLAEEWHKSPEYLRRSESPFNEISEDLLMMYKQDREAFVSLYLGEFDKNWQEIHNLDLDLEEASREYFTHDLADIGPGDWDDDFIDFVLADDESNTNNFVQDIYTPELSEVNWDLFLDRVRYLIFRNDVHDGTVRRESQIGSLDPKYYRVFDGALHGFAPRYPQIQDHVINALKSGYKFFSKDGFPSAGRPLPIWLPDPGETKPITGCEAICRSGYVKEHAVAFAEVAQSENKIILARPVNPDATTLIKNNRATKGMSVKGKSSNWGPQKGLIAADQKFSKIWTVYSGAKRTGQIDKFNSKVNSLLMNEPDVAVKIHFNDFRCDKGEPYEVYSVKSVWEPDAEKAIRLLQEGMWYEWNKSETENCGIRPCVSHCTFLDVDTFFVLADPSTPEGKPLPYTADYDLLGIGIFDRTLFNNPDAEYNPPDFDVNTWDCDRGFISPEQIALNAMLNQAVKDTDYTGGNVVHHGPENHYVNITFPQFKCLPSRPTITMEGSPYVDYPVTAFEPVPGRESAIIRSIRMGPPGFRDIHLKRYIHAMRRRGYDLYANEMAPGWNWGPYDKDNGFQLSDNPNLPEGVATTPRDPGCLCTDDFQGSDQFREILPIEEYKPITQYLSPNPAVSGGDVLYNSIDEIKYPIDINYFTVNGQLLQRDQIQNGPTNRIELNTGSMNPGIYFIEIVFPNKTITEKLIIH